jgi:hypothetical protein
MGWRLVQLKLTQEQKLILKCLVTCLKQLSVKTYSGPPLIAGGESWCMNGAPSQRHNDKAQILRNIGSLFRKSSLCLAAKIKSINCSFGVVLKEFFSSGINR